MGNHISTTRLERDLVVASFAGAAQSRAVATELAEPLAIIEALLTRPNPLPSNGVDGTMGGGYAREPFGERRQRPASRHVAAQDHNDPYCATTDLAALANMMGANGFGDVSKLAPKFADIHPVVGQRALLRASRSMT